MNQNEQGSIGVFDSGYGGLTILREFQRRLPQYDFLYLGDNARAPYGERSFDVVCEFTRQAVHYLFRQGCHLVILACNTASAKALRSIQQQDIANSFPDRRVLGVIRPTIEMVGKLTRNKHIGVLGTPGTIKSGSYSMELEKLYPGVTVTEHACPLWAALVEAGEAKGDGADYFVKKHIDAIMDIDPDIDTLILGCTHYPILLEKIRKYAPAGVRIISQGEPVAESLADYLHRHPEIDLHCAKNGQVRYLTTENPDTFNHYASFIVDGEVQSSRIKL